ncbi:transporter [Granulicella sp. L60]|uniref:SphA family protein n=1 Tax=Granulicella sp. L60 TaxID=1641866 RepID=UPI00131C7AC0|nr:transporter [Granulicella sp. L60]
MNPIRPEYPLKKEIVAWDLQSSLRLQVFLRTASDRMAKLACTMCVLSIFLFFGGNSEQLIAQQNGHYLQGITGLENGSTLPPGVYLSYLPYLNLVDSFKKSDGSTLLDLDLKVVAHNAVYQVTTKKRILGATYGLSFIIPIVNIRLQADTFDKSVQNGGVSDLFLAPVVLGWTKAKAEYLLDYGVYIPAGSFDPNSPSNAGLGFWEHQIQAGATYNIDKKKLWNASLLSTWEINQSKSGEDLKPGPMANFEYSFGRRFFKYQMNAGIVGYAYQKLSPDSGSAVSPLTRGSHDRSFGAGPELKYTDVKHRLAFDARYEPQFGVETKTSGSVVVISITYLNFFPPK